MNVPITRACVVPMRNVPTQLEITLVHAKVDIVEMDIPALVTLLRSLSFSLNHSLISLLFVFVFLFLYSHILIFSYSYGLRRY